MLDPLNASLATSILLSSGWHSIVPGSLELSDIEPEWNEYWFKCQLTFNGEWVVGPLGSIQALGFKGDEPTLGASATVV